MANSSVPPVADAASPISFQPAARTPSSVLLRGVVGGDLRVGEDGFELADEVGGGDDLLADAAERLRRCRHRPWRRT